jgi:hypothetical protein
MMDFLRNWFKPAADKRQEQISAYVDGQLPAWERQRLEQEMAGDAALRQEVEQQQLIKSRVSRLPRQRAPRNFTLNPSLYGRPQPQPATWLFPVMRTATALAAVFFVLAIILEMAGLFVARPVMAPVAMESVPAFELQMAATVEADVVAQEAMPLTVEMEEVEVEGAAPEMQPMEPAGAVVADDAPAAETPPGPPALQRLQATATAPAIPAPAVQPPLAEPVAPLATEPVPLRQPEAEERVKLLSEPAVFSPWRMVQAGLGTAVFILAVITLYLRRRLRSRLEKTPRS